MKPAPGESPDDAALPDQLPAGKGNGGALAPDRDRGPPPSAQVLDDFDVEAAVDGATAEPDSSKGGDDERERERRRRRHVHWREPQHDEPATPPVERRVTTRTALGGTTYRGPGARADLEATDVGERGDGDIPHGDDKQATSAAPAAPTPSPASPDVVARRRGARRARSAADARAAQRARCAAERQHNYVGNADIDALAAEYLEGDTWEDRSRGFTFSTLFSGGIDSAYQAFAPLRCREVGGCEWVREARQLAFERTGLRMYADFDRLKQHDAARFVAEVLIGSAPCVSFSRAGKQRGTADPRGQLYYRQIDVIDWMHPSRRPLVCVFEMVTEVMHVEDGRAQRLLLQRLQAAGYVARAHVLCSRDFGSVGQRVRLFTVGVRSDVHDAVGHVEKPEATVAPRRRVKDILLPLALRPATHVMDIAARDVEWLAPREPDPSYTGPILLGQVRGQGYQWRLYSIEGAAVTQRAGGVNPTGLYVQDGAVIRLTAREAARVMDVDDAVDIGERWGEDAAQHFAGNAISVFTMQAMGLQIKRLIARWRRHPAYVAHPGEDAPIVAADAATLEPHATDDVAGQNSESLESLGQFNESDEQIEGFFCKLEEDPEEPFLGRHEDGCPVFCTRRGCRVCARFSWRAARRLDWLAWLRKERRAGETVLDECLRCDDGRQRERRRSLETTLALWRRRMVEPTAPTELCWWRWPAAHREEIRLGLAIGLLERPPTSKLPNYASGECDAVTEELDRFEASGFLECGDVEVINPSASVPKREAGAKPRVIIDMTKSGVNGRIAQYPTILPSVTDMAAHLYADAWVVETDFKDHFYHYGVRQADRPYLGVRRPRGDGTRRFRKLPMGMRSSPGLCSSRTCVWEDELREQPCFDGELVTNLPGTDAHDPSLPFLYRRDADGDVGPKEEVYVDDLCGVAATMAKGMALLRTTLCLAGRYGFTMKYNKVKGPRRHGRTFHGFEIDTRAEAGGPKLVVRDEVRQEVLQLIELALADRRIVRRALARLVGKLLSLAHGVPHGVTFLRRLWDSLHCLHLPMHRRPSSFDYDCEVELDSEHRKDLLWWETALRDGDGSYLLRNRDVRTRMHYTDGSGFGTGGCGYALGEGKLPRVDFFSGLWRGEAASMTSNWKELRSILLALRRERQRAQRAGTRPRLWRTRIYHATDNSCSESILLKGSSTSPRLQQLLREIAYEQQLMQCDLIPVHVAGKRLIAQGTDGLSRGQTRVGALAGTSTDVDKFNPLTAVPAPLPAPLASWAAAQWPGHTYLERPSDWTTARVLGAATLWMPPPLLARTALNTFLRCRMMAPTTTSAVFLLPRRHTAPWRRLLRHFSSVVSVRAGVGDHWPASEFEPLTVAVCPPWVPTFVAIKGATRARTATRRFAPRGGSSPTRAGARRAAAPSSHRSPSSAATGRTRWRPPTRSAAASTPAARRSSIPSATRSPSSTGPPSSPRRRATRQSDGRRARRTR